VRRPKIKLFWFCCDGFFRGKQKTNVLDWRGLSFASNGLNMVRAAV